jgi:hypothetical protein
MHGTYWSDLDRHAGGPRLWDLARRLPEPDPRLVIQLRAAASQLRDSWSQIAVLAIEIRGSRI